MSYRISLDHPRAGADFVVGEDGSFVEALAAVGHSYPLKIYFKSPAVALEWVKAWEAAEWDYHWNGIGGIFHVDESGYAHDVDLLEPYTAENLREALAALPPIALDNRESSAQS